MDKEDKCDNWDLSLSLRPPITNIARPHFSTDKQKMEIDVKPPTTIDLEETEINKGGSPNSMLSIANGKRHGGLRDETDVASDDEEGGSGSGGGGGERKKLRLSKEQIMVLEHAFKDHTTLNTKQKMTLARQVNLRPRQVEVWFQNRRARTKLKQTEVDCENLKKYCESLTDQNRKLQKELHELRSTLKVSPADQHGKNYPGTTLNMCPSCKTVSVSSSSATTSKTPSNEAGVLHRPVPVNLKKLSLTIDSNRTLEPRVSRG